MNKKGQVTIGSLVLVFMGIVVCLALFTPIINITHQQSHKSVATNQSVDLSSAYVNSNSVNTSKTFTLYSQTAWDKSNCNLSSVSLKNSTGTAWVANTDYVLNPSAGTFTLKNTSTTVPSVTKNQTFGYYTYCPVGYLPDSGNHGVLLLIGILLAIAVLAFVLEHSGITEFFG